MIGVLILATWAYALVQRSRDGRLASKMAKAGQWDHLDNELARRHARSVARTKAIRGIRQKRRDRVAGGPSGPPPAGWRAYRDEVVADFWLDRLEAHRRRRAARGQPVKQDGTSWLERIADHAKRAAKLLIEPVGDRPQSPGLVPDPPDGDPPADKNPQRYGWKCHTCRAEQWHYNSIDAAQSDRDAHVAKCPARTWRWWCPTCGEQIIRHSQADIDAAAKAHQCPKPVEQEIPPPTKEDPVATEAELLAAVGDYEPECPECGKKIRNPTIASGSQALYACTCGRQVTVDIDKIVKMRYPDPTKVSPKSNNNPATSTGATMDHTTTPTGEAAGVLSGGEQAQAIQSSTHRFQEQANAALQGFSKALETLENSARAMGLDDRSDVVKTILTAREAIASQVATVSSTCEQVVSAMATVAAAFGKQGNIAEQRAVVGQVAHDSAYDN